MATSINPGLDPQLNALYSKLGITTQSQAQSAGARASKDKLGQQDFLKLLTTQLANQDPFKPMENGEFISQMAQFSTVSGLDDVKSAISGLGDKLGNNRIATFSNLLGARVLTPGGETRIGEDGVIEGAIDLSDPAANVRVAITNKSGALVDTLDLGSAGAGMLGFSWDAKARGIAFQPGESFKVEALTAGATETTTAKTGIYDVVQGVDIRGTNETLTLRGGKTIGMADVTSIRK